MKYKPEFILNDNMKSMLCLSTISCLFGCEYVWCLNLTQYMTKILDMRFWGCLGQAKGAGLRIIPKLLDISKTVVVYVSKLSLQVCDMSKAKSYTWNSFKWLSTYILLMDPSRKCYCYGQEQMDNEWCPPGVGGGTCPPQYLYRWPGWEHWVNSQ